MSIWCSTQAFGQGHKGWPGEEREGVVLSYATGWSNHYPDPIHGPERPAAIGLATVAPWCTPGHDQDGPGYTCTGCGAEHDHPEAGAWLRIEVASWEHSFRDGGHPAGQPESAEVVIDPAAARALGQALVAWADGPLIDAVLAVRMGAQ